MMAEPHSGSPHPYLWRYLISTPHQGRGIGRRALLEIAGRRRAAGATHIRVSWVPDVVGSPARFYESLGFEPTGVVSHGEVEALLDLDNAAERELALAGSRDVAQLDELAPETVDLVAQRVEVARVVDHVGGRRQPFVAADLAADPIAGVGFVHPSELDQPFDRDLGFDTSTTIVAAMSSRGFSPSKGKSSTTTRSVSACSSDLALDLVLHRRMHDCVEILQGLFGVVGFAEHDRRHGGAIERSVAADDLIAEPLGHSLEQRSAGSLQIASDLIGVDDHGTALGQEHRHR